MQIITKSHKKIYFHKQTLIQRSSDPSYFYSFVSQTLQSTLIVFQVIFL